jgi:hypothetical protein
MANLRRFFMQNGSDQPDPKPGPEEDDDDDDTK